MSVPKPSYAAILQGGAPLIAEYNKVIKTLKEMYRNEPNEEKQNTIWRSIVDTNDRIMILEARLALSLRDDDYDYFDDDRGCSGGICSCCGRTRDN